MLASENFLKVFPACAAWATTLCIHEITLSEPGISSCGYLHGSTIVTKLEALVSPDVARGPLHPQLKDDSASSSEQVAVDIQASWPWEKYDPPHWNLHLPMLGPAFDSLHQCFCGCQSYALGHKINLKQETWKPLLDSKASCPFILALFVNSGTYLRRRRTIYWILSKYRRLTRSFKYLSLKNYLEHNMLNDIN